MTATVTKYFYALAGLLDREVYLCPDCASTYRYPLGHVLLGPHEGDCEECHERELARAAQDIASEALAQGWAEHARRTGEMRYWPTEYDLEWARGCCTVTLRDDEMRLAALIQSALRQALEGGAR